MRFQRDGLRCLGENARCVPAVAAASPALFSDCPMHPPSVSPLRPHPPAAGPGSPPGCAGTHSLAGPGGAAGTPASPAAAGRDIHTGPDNGKFSHALQYIVQRPPELVIRQCIKRAYISLFSRMAAGPAQGPGRDDPGFPPETTAYRNSTRDWRFSGPRRLYLVPGLPPCMS